MAEMPLAIDRRGIVALFQDFGNRHFVGIDAVPGRVVQRARDSDPVWIDAGQERHARGGTDGLRHVEVRQPDALGRHPVEVRRPRPGRAAGGIETADVGVAQIIRIDDDEVGQTSSSGTGVDGRARPALPLDSQHPEQ